MKKQTYSQGRLSRRCGGALIAVLAWGSSLSPTALTVHAQGDPLRTYDRNALLDPSPSLIKAEASGHVTIYDGLDNVLVERALDEQFERIDSMMFVRIRYPQPDGGVEEDDSCD